MSVHSMSVSTKEGLSLALCTAALLPELINPGVSDYCCCDY